MVAFREIGLQVDRMSLWSNLRVAHSEIIVHKLPKIAKARGSIKIRTLRGADFIPDIKLVGGVNNGPGFFLAPPAGIKAGFSE